MIKYFYIIALLFLFSCEGDIVETEGINFVSDNDTKIIFPNIPPFIDAEYNQAQFKGVAAFKYRNKIVELPRVYASFKIPIEYNFDDGSQVINSTLIRGENIIDEEFSRLSIVLLEKTPTGIINGRYRELSKNYASLISGISNADFCSLSWDINMDEVEISHNQIEILVDQMVNCRNVITDFELDGYALCLRE